MKTKLHERSLVLLKPDAVQRGLIGEIISRFEKKGLKITAMRMVWPTKEMAARHYDLPESAAKALGERTLASYAERGEKHKFSEPMEVARDIIKRLERYISTGPIVAMVIEGAHAIAHIRKIRGGVNPLSADIGTITGDYSIDSYFISDLDERAVRTLVHASGNVEEAENEIKIWFGEKDIFDYDLAIEKILYSKDWEAK
ncbi:nucleoside-diphosphate kinase [Candidatus Collierbacteria bacterium]|nr:nucleoside-diphosphate kinase [Candidatus Collierbacteria bacterium]